MFPSPLRIFNQPETRTASPSQPISIRQPNPINFPSPNKHVLSRCTRRIEQGGRHENRQPFGSRFELRDISRMRYTVIHLPLPPCGARNRTREEMIGREPLFPAGVEKAQGRRGAIESRWTYHHPLETTLTASATPSPAAILIGAPPTSRASPFLPQHTNVAPQRCRVFSRFLLPGRLSGIIRTLMEFVGKGNDLDKFSPKILLPSPVNCLN